MNYKTYLLDGDNVRHGLNKDLGFNEQSRIENIRRIGEVSKLFLDTGIIVLTAFISPYLDDRDKAKALIGNDFVEIFVDTSIEECIKRDPKGLYKKAISGEIKNFTGISAPYESPVNPDILIKNITDDNMKYNLAASFQHTVNKILYKKTKEAMRQFTFKTQQKKSKTM